MLPSYEKNVGMNRRKSGANFD